MENQDQNTPVTGTVITPTPQGPGASYTDGVGPAQTTNPTSTVANPVEAPIIPSENSLETPETPTTNSAQAQNAQSVSTQVTSTPVVQPPKKSLNRLIFVIAGIVVLLLIAVVVVANLISRRQSSQLQSPAQSVNEQGITLGSATADTLTALQLEGSQEKLIVNGDIILSGRLSMGSGSFYGQFVVNNLTANRNYVLPDADGTVCLDSNNCNFATEGNNVNSINGVNGILTLGTGLGLQGTTIVNTQNEITANEVIANMVFQGTENQIGVVANGNVISFTTPQDIGTTSTPVFSGVTVASLTVTTGNASLNGVTYTLPSLQGSGVLLNDGSGGLTWTAIGGACPTCFVNGGNNFGSTAVLGTNSAHDLVFETNSAPRMTIDATTGHIAIGNPITPISQTLLSLGKEFTSHGTGIDNAIDFNATSSGINGQGINNLVTVRGPEDYGTIRGATNSVEIQGDGNIDTIQGLSAYVGHMGGGVINESYALHVSTDSAGAGSIYDAYGIYIEDHSGKGTNTSYNLYSAGNGRNRFEGHMGVGNYTGLDILMNNAVLLAIDETSESGYGIVGGLDVTALSSGNVNNAIIADLGLRGDQDYAAGAGIGATARSYTTGTVNLLAAVGGGIYNYDTGTVLQGMGLYISTAENTGGGTIDDNYGVYVQGQNAGTNDYGIRVDAADTQTLWLSGDANNITANAGIAFGLSRDTNLYRSAVGVLRTDNAFSIGTLAATDNASYLCLNSGGIIAGCSGAVTGAAFVQGGNSFGTTATLGTNDNNSLAFETAGTTKLTLGIDGKIVHSPAVSASLTPSDETAFTISFTDTGAINSGMENTSALRVDVARTGATGSATVATYAGYFTATGDTGGTSSIAGILSAASSGDTNFGVVGIGFQTGTSTTASIGGIQGYADTYPSTTGGTVTVAFGLQGGVQMTGGPSTYATAVGLNITSAALASGGLGTITTNYGIKVDTQTAGVSDYGIRVDTADTQTLWIGGTVAGDAGTANTGIAFGSSRDTNLYRSAADTLKTDDKLDVAQKLQVGGNSDFTQCSTIIGLASCTKSFEQSIASTSTTTATWGANFATGITPSAATNTQSNRAVNALLGLYGTQSFSGSNRAIYGAGTNATTAGTVSLLGGVFGEVLQTGGGSTVTEAVGVGAQVTQSNGTLTTAYGMRVLSAGGTIGTNYGLHVQTQTAGTSDYGIRVDAADTQTLWVSGNADNTTAAAGIAFGASRDTNLYRSGADTLKTDDSLEVTNKLQIGTSGGTLSQCGNIIGLFTCSNALEQAFSSSETTVQTYGANFVTGVVPVGATNTVENRAVNASLALYGTQSFSSSLGNYSVSGVSYNATTAGTVALLGGVNGTATQAGAGSTVTEAFGLQGNVAQANGTLSTGYGLRVLSSSGTIANNYGIYVQTQTSGTADYGIRVDSADTQTLWIGGTAAGDGGTANTGIAFGSTRDTNLYRSAANTLKTDDSLHVTNNLGIGVAPGSYKLDVSTDAASYVANFFNDGDNQNRYGIRIQAGADDGSGTTYYLDAYDGDGGQIGYIANTSGTFALTDVSDARTKTNINDTSVDALEILNGLRVVDFNRIQNPDGPLITGFIAQEVQGIYSQAVTTSSSGLLGVAKEAFIPVLVKGVQQQQGQITDMNGRLAAVEQRLNEFSLQQNQGSSTGTLADLNVSGPATIQNLTVTGAATVATLTVTGDARIAGNLIVQGHVLGNADTRGSVTVPAGQTEVKHTFLKAYNSGSQPNVILTPKNAFAPKYRVESTATDFTIYFETQAAIDVIMNYQIQE